MGAARVTVSRGETRPTALVAEDHPLVAQILRRVLEEAGFAVRVESEVDETVTAAQHEHPALLLLDVQLAGGARFAALEQIAALRLIELPPDDIAAGALAVRRLGSRGRHGAQGTREWRALPGPTPWRLPTVGT